MKRWYFRLLLLTLWSLTGAGACMDYGPMEEEDFDTGQTSFAEGLFIVNEGNFMYGNASLSYYDTKTRQVENAVFTRANGISLGDVAQSMTIRDGIGWIVVNNSGVIFAIDINTFKVIGQITGFTSPRYIHFLSDTKAYVTQLWDNRICIVNPQTCEITGYIPTPLPAGSESTEQMVQYGQYVFTNCWSYDDKILVIDTETDTAEGYIQVGKQPTSLVIDRNDKLWTITDGGYEGSPYGQEAPALYRIDAATRRVEQVFPFEMGDRGSEICMNGTRDTLYFINKHIWRMAATSDKLPDKPFLENPTTNHWYGLTVNPYNSDVYLADAIDYTQPGRIYRYNAQGELLDQFEVGIIPGAFCFK